ncbi:MAG: type II secretion system protein [Nitrospirae bacterium]|nr:type II secretion system protein [Nitrospirota bacterium]MBI3352379.1 type II secretion system protein [Nitrospirota bacterium]
MNHIARQKGFTLIEFVIVILIVAILSAAAYELLGDSTTTKVYGTARKIQSDITYAQEQAMTHRVHYRVQFTTATNSYTVQACSNQNTPCPGWSSILDPSTNASPFAIALNTGSYTSVLLFSTTFGCDYLEFNSAGVPMEGSAGVCPTPPVSITGFKTVTLNPGGRTVTVVAGTGKTSVP